MHNPRRIIVHHSATVDGKTFSWDAIRMFHVEHNHWIDIGYHAGCELVNDSYVCLYGRPVTLRGAHAAGANADSLGFCFVGNYDQREPEVSMLAVASRRVLAPWCAVYGISVEQIRPHNEFANKSCPGRRFPMDDLRRMVQAALTGQGG